MATANTGAIISFNPKQVTARLLKALPERARDVLSCRFGLGKETKRQTLDSIGKRYRITRERVRQIENYALASIRKADAYQKEKAAFAELEKALPQCGGIVVRKRFSRTSLKTLAYATTRTSYSRWANNLKRQKKTTI